ncbi:MAG: acetyltransferase, partial [Anaerolineae bacterium]|nr:acetyltransferase [Anaerolineae bacterium]
MTATTTPPLVIWGASGHARVVADIVRVQGIYRIAGYLDDRAESPGAEFNGGRILGGQERLPILLDQGITHLIIGIGNCWVRLALADVAETAGFTLAAAIHSSAVIAAGVDIGGGTVIAAGCVINPAARIGCNVIVNTSASVDHDCVLADGVHISPGAHLAGGVTVGRGTWVGIGSVVKEQVTIGAGSMIGAGSVVLADIPDGVMAYG